MEKLKRMPFPSSSGIAIGWGVLMEIAAVSQLLYNRAKPPVALLILAPGILLFGFGLSRPSYWPRILAGVFLVLLIWIVVRQWYT